MKWVANAGSLQPYLAAALLPAGSHLAATGELDRLRSMYRKSYRYLFLVGLPPFFFLTAHAEFIIRVWLGQANHQAALIMVLLCVGYAANSLSNGMAYVCQGVGRPDIQAVQSVVQLLLNVGCSIVLFMVIGPLGTAVGTSVALVAGACVFVIHFHRYMRIPSLSLLRETALIPCLASLAAAVISRFFMFGSNPADRWAAFGVLVLAGLLFVAVYLGICLVTGHIDRRDLDRLSLLRSHGEGKV
jgi:O-antigen/teichoic acid export membrane protein